MRKGERAESGGGHINYPLLGPSLGTPTSVDADDFLFPRNTSLSASFHLCHPKKQWTALRMAASLPPEGFPFFSGVKVALAQSGFPNLQQPRSLANSVKTPGQVILSSPTNSNRLR